MKLRDGFSEEEVKEPERQCGQTKELQNAWALERMSNCCQNATPFTYVFSSPCCWPLLQAPPLLSLLRYALSEHKASNYGAGNTNCGLNSVLWWDTTMS